MSTAERTLRAFDHLVQGTRTHLAAVPEDRLGWRPHEKSWTLGELASHIANLPHWTVATLQQDELDLAPPDGSDPPRAPLHHSVAALLEAFDQSTAAARAAIESASDEEYRKPWALLVGGEARFSLPKVAVLRAFVMDHLIHHRGQLTVYLRLCDAPVNQTFGPTADFPDM